MVGGLIFIAMSFIGWTLPVFLIVLAVVTLVPIGYSYMLYKKGT